MISSKDQLLSMLNAANIEYHLYEHQPVFTVDDMQYCAHIPGAHVKNLFLQNRKKTVYLLVTVPQEKRVDLSALEKKLKLDRLSFASSEDLITNLGIQPGSVTPLAIINDSSKKIKLFFDNDLLKEEYISIHPMENTATIRMKLADLLKFIENNRLEEIEFIELSHRDK